MLRSILYVSNSALVYSNGRETRIDELVRQSRIWNHSVAITGALVFTERNFVQFIEGPEDSIADLLGKIHADRRHSGVDIIEDSRANDRHFQSWSLAYSGPDTFIDNDLAPLLNLHIQAERSKLAVNLRMRMHAMANV
jgi:hypothetical protein